MLKFSKNACHYIIGSENRSNEKIVNISINRLSMRLYLAKGGINTECKFSQTHCKQFTLLKDYMVEKKIIFEGNEKRENERTYNELDYKRKIISYNENSIDNFFINHNLYASLKNIFLHINKINKAVTETISLKCENVLSHEIVQNNVYINNNLYTFYVEIPNKYINNISLEIEKILQDEEFSELFRKIKDLDLYTSTLLFVLFKQIGKRYNGKWNKVYTVLFQEELENFILQNVRTHISNIIPKGNKNKTEDNAPNISKTHNKVDLHQVYREILNILNILKKEKEKYINYIDFILHTLFKELYRHNRHYNYSYSISLLRVLNDILLFHLNHSCESHKGEKDEHRTFCTQINNNRFYTQKEKFTWNYIEKNYEDIECIQTVSKLSTGGSITSPSKVDTLDDGTHLRNGNAEADVGKMHVSDHLHPYKDATKCTGKFNCVGDFQNCQRHSDRKEAQVNYDLFSHTYEENCTHVKSAHSNKNSVRDEGNIASNSKIHSYLSQFCIFLIAIIAKKIKYMENRTVLIDEECMLEGINALLHMHERRRINLDKIINERVPFLKDTTETKGSDEKQRVLQFLNFIFNILKSLKYDHKNAKEMKKEYETYERLFKILSLVSSIRYLLTDNIKNKNATADGTDRQAMYVGSASADLAELSQKRIISKINKNITQMSNELILTASNFSCTPHSHGDINREGNVAVYMSYIFNDLYFQNNYQIQNIMFSYFLKHFKNRNSYVEGNKNVIYLEYITIYNFLKLFQKDINESSVKYDTILKIFMDCFDNNLYHKLKDHNFLNNFYAEKKKTTYYLHFLNKLCYFYFLAKRFISNREFLSHINYHFYLTVYLINQFIEKNMNNSEFFIRFVNKCINKITIILTVQKYFNLCAEEDLTKCVSNFLQLTHKLITKENKKKLLLYVLPFLKQPKNTENSLKHLLVGKEIELEKEKKKEAVKLDTQKKGNHSKNEEEEHNSCEHVKSVIYENKQNNLNCNLSNYEENESTNLSKKGRIVCVEQNLADFIDILQKKDNFKVNNGELCQLLREHMRQNHLLKKENVILKNKLNYIVLNFENFISSYVRTVPSANHAFVCHDNGENVGSTRVRNMHVRSVSRRNVNRNIVGGTNLGNTAVELNCPAACEPACEPACEHTCKHTCEHTCGKGVTGGDTDEETHRREDAPSLSIQFDYHNIDVTNEYFHELRKHENQNYMKINNVLINMYMYNPHICAKNKKILISKEKKTKKMIILPYDTYKNIKKLVIYEDNEGVNLIKRFHNSVYLFFVKMKFFFCKSS
ncbi:conserved Plasmodium protein, unknown function [Plasmodium ovale wallikeri]|uniref:Uncharacterized protein n=1 Tax=Plasmodium ovale wallikeri TaxID=864142 RepID=A0A1A8YU07_PLAOA|nr:conserved Plasmodium protein, unknown function [Plasmodium ovale wallikeri]